MNTANTNFIKLRDTGIALAFIALCAASFYAFTRLGVENRENTVLRDQNHALAKRLQDLDESFRKIHDYTSSVDALASGDAMALRPTRALADMSGMGVAAKMENFVGFQDSNMPKALAAKSETENFSEMLDLVNRMNSDSDMLVRRLQGLASILRHRKDLLANVPSIMPVEGRVSSEFGMRLSPFGGARHMHEGIDIAATIGTKILAPADGEVTFAGEFVSLGKSIVINHGNGVLTRYGHTSKLLVHVGQKVKRGQAIAIVGSTGHSTGPHLHYEVWIHNSPVNPRDFFFDMADHNDVLVMDHTKRKPTAMVRTHASIRTASASIGSDL